MNNTLNSYEYLKRLSETYKEEKTLTGMINSYRVISEDYNKLNKIENTFNYSSYDYNECSEEEQYDFFTNQLQFVECLVTNTIYDKVGTIQNWMYIYNLLYNSDYKMVEKINRRVIYSTMGNDRPIGDMSYQMWNGLQVIDLDIKDAELSDKLKPLIFDELKKFNWFLGVCKSASGKGIHVWTKITPISVEFNNKKIEYLCNFRHKYSYVYVVLDKYAKDLGYSKENIIGFMDMAMSKPQQGSFIAYDKALLNTNFKDYRLDVNFEGAFDCGVSSVDWIAHPELKQIFSKLEWFNNDAFDKEVNIEIKDISNLQERNTKRMKGPKHYKHSQRWQLANTLTNLFGVDNAFKIMCEICKETSTRELKGDVKTASIHNKPISIWAVKELNSQHGFNIKIENNDVYAEKTKQLEKELQEADKRCADPTKILNDKTDQVMLYMKSNQFLSHIKDDIVANLSQITLLEAGAGYGKTEMIKSLKAKTLLILPFTSTIKAKVEASSVTKDWLYFYGNKRPDTADLMGNRNMSMTIDKFSRLNIYELDAANFEYIVIDESHLLFTSSYRDVMGPCIQRLANCKAKVIMMTGTPTGESVFFPNIKHIRVKKEDLRIKEFNLNYVVSRHEQMVEMTKSMAQDIMNGIRILFPTNNGVTYYEEIIGLVQEHLCEMHFGRELKSFYYKKSNYGDQSMEDINRASTVGENDIICCSTYLSVGVDICDKGKFSIYFDKLWIPQDIEQFANRIRNNDLYIKMFLPTKDSAGMPINYYYTEPLDLGFNKKDLLFARDLIRTCNDMLERNQEESKYSPLIQSLISSNRYLKYDENDCKYYIDETTYKLKVFEERYSNYSTQLEVMLEGIKYYGYDVKTNTNTNAMSEEKIEWLNEFIKTCKNKRFNEVTIETKEFLAHIDDTNIDKYRDLLRGNYELFKDEKYEVDRIENKLYTKSIEILEKNAPIVISLYKYYDCETIRDIYDFCTETKSNRINFSKLERIRQFANIQNAINKKRLDFPMLKYITEARKWALANPYTTKQDIDMFIATWSANYCNMVEDVVVDDIQYLESIRDNMQQLWPVIIVQGRPRKNIIPIKPFELLWQTKLQLNNIYGDMKTQTFFLEQLLGETIEEETEETVEEVLPELEHTHKLKIEDVEDKLSELVSEDYNYNIYSNIKREGEELTSNERFMRKQENTNQLRDNIFRKIDENETKEQDTQQSDLFGEVNELPF